MAPMIFTKAIIEKKPIKIFNYGKMFRDFTYIDDVVFILLELIRRPAHADNDFNEQCPNPSSSWAPSRIYNIGNNNSVSIIKFIELLEKELNIKSEKILMPMQQGDIIKTAANVELINKLLGKTKQTSLEDGIKKFIKWYKEYFLN
jgi:UDP-glucuronate 4-epimerase